MLTMVTVQNLAAGTLLLPLMDSSGGYSVKDIQGLDPVKATLVSSKLAQMDGGELQNARREPRNITMKLGLEPDYVTNTVASLRSNLYRYLMPKSLITFALYADDILFGSTEAVVESMENNMFSPDPANEIALYNTRPDLVTNRVSLQGSFLPSDVLEINTNPGRKSVTVTRAGLPIPSLYYLDKDSSWISLKQGANLFRAYYVGTSIAYTVKYTAKYGGF